MWLKPHWAAWLTDEYWHPELISGIRSSYLFHLRTWHPHLGCGQSPHPFSCVAELCVRMQWWPSASEGQVRGAEVTHSTWPGSVVPLLSSCRGESSSCPNTHLEAPFTPCFVESWQFIMEGTGKTKGTASAAVKLLVVHHAQASHWQNAVFRGTRALPALKALPRFFFWL